MIKKFRNIFNVIIVLSLLQCKTDSEIIPENHDRYIINLTKDLKFLDVEYYIENNLRFKSIFNYQTDKVQIRSAYDNIGYLKTSTYFLGSNGLADSCIDSMFLASRLSQLFIFKFTYDNNGYRISSDLTSSDIKNDTIYSTSHYFNTYDILNGNNITGKGSYCSFFYDYSSLPNKVDIDFFLGSYAGHKNTNLMRTSNSDCHPGPGEESPSSIYDYTLDSSGFVSQRIETFRTYDHHDPKAKISRFITEYIYLFQ